METRSLFVTIAGRANAGKSSLLNAIIGEKIAMVTDKPQTTRTKITGVLTEGGTQYVFMDTPGIHKAHNKLGEHMNRAVENSLGGTDVIVYMADVTRKINEIDKNAVASFAAGKTPVILLINKIDLLPSRSEAAEKIAEMGDLMDFKAVIPVSVRERDGLDILMSELEGLALPSPHYFPDDKITDQPERVIMSEIVREKLMILMHDEIPHGIAVTIEQMGESVTKSGEDILDISAVIYCERESHKGMVIGKGGTVLKKAGQLAREELEQFFRIKVNLKLWVKVKEDWRNREGLIRNFGLSE
ncbi:MAG: GTPase Era [Ruminococcus sp.]|nr:GTPase Era [Ruminococcus sp.]